MAIYNSFEAFDSSLQHEFRKNGFIVVPCSNLEGLKELRKRFQKWVTEITDFDEDKNNDCNFFDNFHEKVFKNEINEIRLKLYSRFNSENWSRPTVFSLAQPAIEAIVSNELVMQNRINVNIMMPNDEGSNQPVHIDAHSGESAFQCVLWIPFSNAHDSKGIFLLPKDANREAQNDFKSWMTEGGQNRVMNEIKDKVIWPEVPFGSLLLFTPTLLHGSVVNETNETRWSLNTRFKGLFSPYSSQEKGLGTFYLPIRTLPGTNFGLEYSPPVGFKEK